MAYADLRQYLRSLEHDGQLKRIAEPVDPELESTSFCLRTLQAGGPVIVDARMVAAGIMADRLPRGAEILLTLDDPRVRGLAGALATTRSAAAVELWRPRLAGAVVAIGNAPTALFHLLDRLRDWPERPAAILAFPVGFVGAAESKDALIAAGLEIPWLTLRGRRGGSALAAAAVNALMVDPT